MVFKDAHLKILFKKNIGCFPGKLFTSGIEKLMGNLSYALLFYIMDSK
jgi:hypothetical protein